MAEQIPYGVARSLISKLASLAFDEIGRIYHVSSELDRLKDIIESIQVVLSDAEQKQDEDQVIVHWIRKFKEVLHEADDLIDALEIKDLRRKVNAHSKAATKVRDFFSPENPLVFRSKLARKIENIRKKFNDVADDMSKLKLSPSSVVLQQPDSADWKETGSFVLQSTIIGREEDKSKIIELLKQGHTNQNVSLIAIVGMGGLGKTALAQMVYNDAEQQKIFQKYMWVCISEDFEVKVVLKKILKFLKNGEIGELELSILEKQLREELNGQRYMLVLDDVWNENPLKWNDLKNYLMCGREGSKILVTARSQMVAKAMAIDNPYVLKGLTSEQSWGLLKNLALDEHARRISPNIVSIGEKIAEKCGGVPLAIRTIGGLLQSKTEESEWLNISKGDFWRLCKEKNSIMPVLKRSYQDLPLELRQCFAYCSLYPKDWTIQKNELIQLWMAQGYLKSSMETESMEDMGNKYVKTLLMKSFFQEASVSDYDGITSFKMHDLMHDLAGSIAGNDCYMHSQGKEFVGRCMHVSSKHSSGFSLDLSHASRVRTILWNDSKYTGIVLKSSIMKNLKYLRALQFSNSFICELPKSIDKLKHLRYLDLECYGKLTSLPQSIGNLVSLQTLKLWGCGQLSSLPQSIGNLVSLQTLELGECDQLSNLPESIGNLVSLQTLMLAGCGQLASLPESIGNLVSLQILMLVGCTKLVFPIEIITKLISLRYLDIHDCPAFEDMTPAAFEVGDDGKIKPGKLNELKDLNTIRGAFKLRNLQLVRDVASASQEANLNKKKYIQQLELHWEGDTSEEIDYKRNTESLQLLDYLCPHQNLRELVVDGYPGVQFSSWLSSITNIVQISLNNFSNCQHLPPMERLPSLKSLHISLMNKLEYIEYEESSDMFFPSLETLSLEGCTKLKGWKSLTAGDNANDIHSPPPFPLLFFVGIVDCPELTCMPAFPHLYWRLSLRDSSVKPLRKTCLVQRQSSSFRPLSGLKDLNIGGIDNIEEMGEEWMQNLTSLQTLSLSGSSVVRPMLRHLQHLPVQLQQLGIHDIDDEDLDTQTQWQALHALQSITIHRCQNLKALPEWICRIQSLTRLCIRSCKNLESLPEGMRCLTNLRTLEIQSCPLLLDRCQTETGQDWHKISHIRNIRIF